jgi:hypothetical protein
VWSFGILLLEFLALLQLISSLEERVDCSYTVVAGE